MSERNKASAPRIAIKFGAPSNNNSKKLSRPNPPSALGKRPRSHALGGASDSESDDDQHRGRHEKITGFGADGAETERKAKDARTEKKEYVIARQANRDWRSEVKAQKKGKNLLPEEARAQQAGVSVETEPADQDKGLKWGLTIKEKAVEDEQGDAEPEATEDTAPKDDASKEPPQKRTADDEAMDALLGNKAEDEKVIHPSEEDAYQRDIKETGEASTLDDYEAMPVEEFGAALLRGMGWDGKPRGAVKEVKRRPNRLGLGAKELKEAEDLGGWNQNGKKNRRPRLDEYRREESKRKDSRRHEDSYKRERERERDRHGHRDRDRDRDRARDYDRHRDRDRHRDYDRDRLAILSANQLLGFTNHQHLILSYLGINVSHPENSNASLLLTKSRILTTSRNKQPVSLGRLLLILAGLLFLRRECALPVFTSLGQIKRSPNRNATFLAALLSITAPSSLRTQDTLQSFALLQRLQGFLCGIDIFEEGTRVEEYSVDMPSKASLPLHILDHLTEVLHYVPSFNNLLCETLPLAVWEILDFSLPLNDTSTTDDLLRRFGSFSLLDHTLECVSDGPDDGSEILEDQSCQTHACSFDEPDCAMFLGTSNRKTNHTSKSIVDTINKLKARCPKARAEARHSGRSSDSIISV